MDSPSEPALSEAEGSRRARQPTAADNILAHPSYSFVRFLFFGEVS
jgi:hypothetical protein